MWSHRVTIGWDGPLWRTSVPILHDVGSPSEGHRIVRRELWKCQEVWVFGAFFCLLFWGWWFFLNPVLIFSKLLIDVQSRGSAKFRRMWHEMLKKSWGKVNNARLTTHHTSPHPISFMNRGPTDGIGLGSASSCVSWPRQASASCDVPGLVEIQWKMW